MTYLKVHSVDMLFHSRSRVGKRTHPTEFSISTPSMRQWFQIYRDSPNESVISAEPIIRLRRAASVGVSGW